MLKTKVKAGAISNLTDARYFAAREVEWLGFDFSAGSEAYISPAQMLAIKEWVDGVKFVGEFNLESLEDIRSGITELELDAVQVGMAASDDTVSALVDDLPVFKEIVLDYYHSDEDLREQITNCPSGITFFIINLEKNGFNWNDIKNGTPFSLTGIKEICTHYPVLLALNYQPEDTLDILKELPIKGLHLKGGEEEKVGFKSFDDLDEIFDLLELEN